MNETIRGKIVLLTVGDAMKTYYKVGNTFPHPINATIVEIVRDNNYFIEHNKSKFYIYVENNKKQVRLFEEIENMPVKVQYDVNDELVNHI